MNAYTRTDRPCPCGCGTRGLCDTHKARLAKIKAEMAGKGRFHETTQARGYRPPKCCNPGCGSLRPRGEHFCAECVQDGWTKDTA